MLFKKYVCVLMMILMFISMIFSDNLFFVWMFYEALNLFMVIYLNFNNNKYMSCIYFILMSFTGVLLVGFIMIGNSVSVLWVDFYLSDLVIFLVMMFKLGIFPFNYWIIFLCCGMTWFEICLLCTLCKFSFIYFLLMVVDFNWCFIYFIVLGSFFVSLSLKNLSSYKSIMASSSIIQSSFIFILGLFDFELMSIFVLFYLIYFCLLCFMFGFLNINDLSSLLNVSFSSTMKFTYVSLVLGYSGFPPFCCFFLKWIIVSVFFYNSIFYYIFVFVYTFSSVMVLWVYVGFFSYSLVGYFPSMKKPILYSFFFSKYFSFFLGLSLVLSFTGFMFVGLLY